MRNVPALAMMLLAPLALAALLGFAFGGGQSFSIAATKVAVANADTGAPGRRRAENAGAVVVERPEEPGARGHPRGQREAVGRRGARAASTTARRRRPSSSPPTSARVVFGTELDGAEDRRRGLREPHAGDRRRHHREHRRPGAAGLQRGPGRGDRRQRAGHRQRRRRPRRRAGAAGRREVPARRRRGRRRRASRSARRSCPAARPPRMSASPATILAGMMIFFMFFGANNVARTILDEDRAGTLPRLFTTPTPRQHDPRRQVQQRLRDGHGAGRDPAGRRPLHLQHRLGPARRRGGAHAGGRGGRLRPGAAPDLAGAHAGAGRRHRRRRLSGAGPARRQLHRHGGGTAAPTPTSRSSRPTAGCCRAGTPSCAAAGSPTSCPTCSSLWLFAIVFFAVAVLRFRKRYA